MNIIFKIKKKQGITMPRNKCQTIEIKDEMSSSKIIEGSI